MSEFDILNAYEPDEIYKAFIRNQPCIICQGAFGKSHPHHVYVGGMGMKCSDYHTIPLCDFHHTKGNEAIHKMGLSKFEHYHNRNIKTDIIFFLSKYIKEKLHGRT